MAFFPVSLQGTKTVTGGLITFDMTLRDGNGNLLASRLFTFQEQANALNVMDEIRAWARDQVAEHYSLADIPASLGPINFTLQDLVGA